MSEPRPNPAPSTTKLSNGVATLLRLAVGHTIRVECNDLAGNAIDFCAQVLGLSFHDAISSDRGSQRPHK